MLSLASLAMRQVSLEDLIDIGLDNLPASDDFLSSLAEMISPEIINHYKGIGWSKFRDDLIFLLEHEGQPLYYLNISLYWSTWGDGYLLLSAEINDTASNHFYYETLDEVLGQIFVSLIELHEIPRSGEISEDVVIEKKFRQVLEFMAKKNRNIVNKLLDHLKKGELIELNGETKELSIFPLTETGSAKMVLDKDKLVIVGLTHITLVDSNDPESIAFSDPYIVCFSREDAKLVLSTLAYNPYAYRILQIFPQSS